VGRSYDEITVEGLGRLAAIAAADPDRFFHARPEYRHRLVWVAMC
jgi:hypothetical protein